MRPLCAFDDLGAMLGGSDPAGMIIVAGLAFCAVLAAAVVLLLSDEEAVGASDHPAASTRSTHAGTISLAGP